MYVQKETEYSRAELIVQSSTFVIFERYSAHTTMDILIERHLIIKSCTFLLSGVSRREAAWS